MQQFNVKDGSVQEFFATHGVGIPQDDRRSLSSSTVSAYHMMKDKILVKKSDLFDVGEFIVFELFDQSVGSKRALVNTYTYIVGEYDDVCIELELTNFEISLKEDQ
jgi:hypothetical protein